MREKISLVVPCYNEEESLPYFYEEVTRIAENLKKVNFEFVFVNDCSKDNTLEYIKELKKKDKRVEYISLSRNFGKEGAVLAGLEHATGDYVATLDADLQDPPSLLEEMYRLIKEEDYDVVACRRTTRKGEPPIRSFFARRFYKLINKISKTEMVDGARDFRLMRRQVVDSILTMREYNRYSKGLFTFVGFKTKWLEYKNVERVAGNTKWSFWNLLVYAFEGIIGFSTVPLMIPFVMSLLFSLVAFVLFVIIVVNLIIDVSISSVLLVFWLIFFVGGVQLFSLGIIGAYLSKVYSEIKKRPIYIIKEMSKGLKRRNIDV